MWAIVGSDPFREILFIRQRVLRWRLRVYFGPREVQKNSNSRKLIFYLFSLPPFPLFRFSLEKMENYAVLSIMLPPYPSFYRAPRSPSVSAAAVKQSFFSCFGMGVNGGESRAGNETKVTRRDKIETAGHETRRDTSRSRPICLETKTHETRQDARPSNIRIKFSLKILTQMLIFWSIFSSRQNFFFETVSRDEVARRDEIETV